MTMQADSDAIRTLVEGINRAHSDRDARAIIAPFASDATLFDLSPPLAHGVSEKATAAWLDTWDGPVSRKVHNLEITVGGDLAYAHGYIHTAAVSNASGALAEWWSRATFCLARRAGRWLIVHEHTSVPFYMDGSLKAALDLKP
ncbi:ketosteroid isomerase-like protein [Povalibacter uvarum]|uniref:Ketosteroid isomerase-like protein n=1 Tax=Povalibacter uvarum TaxID=732238 RepID=A0A841HWC4_9GAMM|nr:nuclear transport factor 2 family protein [Povalibacter uvarum]MBB6096208.1 ketosteroid isomerase-like protein [Povalibacter uvarum]